MNSIWNKNKSLFKARFPSLFALLGCDTCDDGADERIFFESWKISPAKNGSVSAMQQGLWLHSSYNPEKEAFSLVSKELSSHSDCSALVFCGFGLGYGAIEAAKLLKKQNNNGVLPDDAQSTVQNVVKAAAKKTLVLIEPDANCFFCALSLLDWSDVFAYENIILLISCPPEQCMSVLNNLGILKSVFFTNKAHAQHAKAYFDTLSLLVERNRKKETINEATTKKFGKRWNVNCLKNAETVSCLDGIAPFKDCATGLPFTVIAAGPSLSTMLSSLKDVQDRTVTVCVDTALRACLSVGVEPDFIIISDPQYWAYRHIADLKAPRSILIASSDVYPSVFRFQCKKIICASSQLPIGKYFEAKCGVKGDLGAGGSVASCAWNFAAYCGAKKIFLLGLDFAFAEKQTHFKGSAFEEAAHVSSLKITPAENFFVSSMISGNAEKGENYVGESVATDQRMKMFAWWFESRIAERVDVKTYTFFERGLKIPGVAVSSLADAISLPAVESQKAAFLRGASKGFMDAKAIEMCKKKYKAASKALKIMLADVDMADFSAVERKLH